MATWYLCRECNAKFVKNEGDKIVCPKGHDMTDDPLLFEAKTQLGMPLKTPLKSSYVKNTDGEGVEVDEDISLVVNDEPKRKSLSSVIVDEDDECDEDDLEESAEIEEESSSEEDFEDEEEDESREEPDEDIRSMDTAAYVIDAGFKSGRNIPKFSFEARVVIGALVIGIVFLIILLAMH